MGTYAGPLPLYCEARTASILSRPSAANARTAACAGVRKCPSTSTYALTATTLIPSSKFDIASAERAVAAGWPAVEPVALDLLEWLQDYNWPVSRVLAPFLARVGAPLVPYLRPILAGDDAIWKYWVIIAVLADSPPEVVEALRPELQRIVEDPTAREVEEEAPRSLRPPSIVLVTTDRVPTLRPARESCCLNCSEGRRFCFSSSITRPMHAPTSHSAQASRYQSPKPLPSPRNAPGAPRNVGDFQELREVLSRR